MDYSQLMNTINQGASSPLLMPRKDIDQVDGKNGASALAIGPDSRTLALDKSVTNDLVVWFIQTDSMGNKTTVAGYKLTPYVPEQPPDFGKLQSMMESMNAKMDAQKTAYDDLSSRLAHVEEALK